MARVLRSTGQASAVDAQLRRYCRNAIDAHLIKLSKQVLERQQEDYLEKGRQVSLTEDYSALHKFGKQITIIRSRSSRSRATTTSTYVDGKRDGEGI